MRDESDGDDAELTQFASLSKKASRLGYVLERTMAGYRLDAPGRVLHLVDLDAVALVFERPPGLYRNLTKPNIRPRSKPVKTSDLTAPRT